MNITLGPWQVRDLELTPEKTAAIWKQLQRHTTLFSDLTRGDISNFVRAITSNSALWYEVRENGTLVGLIWFSDLYMVTDLVAHMAFFDRKSFEKLPICKAVVKQMFKELPIHRMTVTPPVIYKATVRLLKRIGFAEEGRKREAVLLSGRWHDQLIFGITRSEAEALRDEFPSRQDPAA